MRAYVCDYLIAGLCVMYVFTCRCVDLGMHVGIQCMCVLYLFGGCESFLAAANLPPKARLRLSPGTALFPLSVSNWMEVKWALLCELLKMARQSSVAEH